MSMIDEPRFDRQGPVGVHDPTVVDAARVGPEGQPVDDPRRMYPPTEAGWEHGAPRAAYPDYYDRGRPGFGEGASRFARRYLHSPETKEFFRTSEFFLTVFVLLAMMIAAMVHEVFDAENMWPLVTLLVGAYVLSRGIAKAGTRTDGRDRFATEPHQPHR